MCGGSQPTCGKLVKPYMGGMGYKPTNPNQGFFFRKIPLHPPVLQSEKTIGFGPEVEVTWCHKAAMIPMKTWKLVTN